MTAELDIQYIWKHGLYSGKLLSTTSGQFLEILHPGEQNFHAGPDFFNARIRLGPLVWAGNVEVHLFASHWNMHGHHLDPAYDNVILHVIHFFDREIKNSKGRTIPSLIIDPFTLSASRIEGLSKNANWLHCHNFIGEISEKSLKRWFRHLYKERLEQKVRHINNIIDKYRDNKEKALLMAMASGFGLPINSLPFEMMVSGIPVSLLGEIKESLPDVEALLFGQSGFLQTPLNEGPYTLSLFKGYTHLKKAVSSNPLPPHLWKFLRIRPASFPTLRLSQFACLIHKHFPLYENFIESKSILEIGQKLQLESSSYWNTHYTFGKPSPYSVKRMGKPSILNLSINVLIPFMRAIYKRDPEKYAWSKQSEIPHKLTAESNHIIKKWSIFGIEPCNAAESQALIQLYNAYCKRKRCPDCQIWKMNPSCSP